MINLALFAAIIGFHVYEVIRMKQGKVSVLSKYRKLFSRKVDAMIVVGVLLATLGVFGMGAFNLVTLGTMLGSIVKDEV